MRVQPWSDTPSFLTKFKTLYFDKNGTEKLNIISSRVHGNIVLVKAEGIDNIDKAAVLRGKILYMDRNDAPLEEGRYYYQDLIGCRVYNADNEILYGELTDISETGANDVWHITDENKKEYLIPAIGDVVIDVDIEKQVVKIRPLRGIFEDED